MAKPTEDPHFVDARPSFVVQLRSADVLIDGGAELEIGWLPPLLQNARNPKIEVGKPGRVAGVARGSLDECAGERDPRGRRRSRAGQSAFHDRSDHRENRRATYRAIVRRGRSGERGRSTTRTTRNSRRRSTPSSRNGARPCCRSKGKASSLITIRGLTSRTASA